MQKLVDDTDRTARRKRFAAPIRVEDGAGEEIMAGGDAGVLRFRIQLGGLGLARRGFEFVGSPITAVTMVATLALRLFQRGAL